MRILLAAPASERHTLRWVEYFVSHGDEVHVATLHPKGIEGVKVHSLASGGKGKLRYLGAVGSLKRILAQVKPDIVNAHYISSYGFISAMAGARPLVQSAWGSDILPVLKDFGLRKKLCRYACSRSDYVLTVAEHMNPYVRGLGVPDEKIRAVPFGVDLSRFPFGEPRNEGGPLRIICTRSFRPIYNIPTLIKAVAAVKAQSIPLALTLVSDGPLRGEIEQLIAELGLKDDVRFTGYLDPLSLAAELRGADLFVSPALSDGNNVSLNEAMASGCFPIATDIPANSQWLDHGKNGLLYRGGDVDGLTECLMRAARDVELRQASRDVNRKIVEERADWAKNAAEVSALFERLVAARR